MVEMRTIGGEGVRRERVSMVKNKGKSKYGSVGKEKASMMEKVGKE